MSKKFFRQISLVRALPNYPYKLTSSQLQSQLKQHGIDASLRTIQRDLEEMSEIDFFGVFCDQRSRPHGWSRINEGTFSIGGSMPLTLAISLKIWSVHAKDLLPPSIYHELRPLISHASLIVSKNKYINSQLNLTM